MINMGPEIFEQIRSAYKDMASQEKYRPAAPSDGLGNITVPVAELNIEREAAAYAEQWWKQEDHCVFNLGCCDFRTRRAAIFATEAAHLMNGGSAGNSYALILLRMAAKELERVTEKTRAAKGAA
jgi:hypothetical protein